MSIEIYAVLLAAALGLASWGIKKRITKKKDSIKDTSDVDNVDSLTIKNLADVVEKLQGLYSEQLLQNAKFAKTIGEQAKQISDLEKSYNLIAKQNRELSQINEGMTIEFDNLKKENESLRRLIVDKQIEE